MNRVVAVSVSMAALIAALLGVARWAGQAFPTDRAAALTPGETCTQPCWHGITPHQTSLREALDKIQADPSLVVTEADPYHLCWAMPATAFAQGCVYSFRNAGELSDLVEIVTLTPRPGAFSLGDAVLFFGTLVTATLPCYQAISNVYFAASAFVTIPVSGAVVPFYRPDLAVSTLSYIGRQNVWYDARSPRWAGFGPAARYSGCSRRR